MADVYLGFKQKNWYKTNFSRDIQLEYISEIDTETEALIEKYDQDILFRRRAEDLNWMFRYPWLLSAPFIDKESHKFNFSSTVGQFYYLFVKIYVKNSLVGFCVMRFRDNFLSIPFLYYQPDYVSSVMKVIGYHLIKKNVSALTIINHQMIRDFESIGFPVFKIKGVKKESVISKLFSNIDFHQHYFHDGYGDCAFT